MMQIYASLIETSKWYQEGVCVQELQQVHTPKKKSKFVPI